MPQFTNLPPDDGKGPSLPIVRTPAGRPLVAVVTSSDLLGCNTHFYGGRTQPCEAPDCKACQEGISWRWHGYVSAVDVRNGKHFLFEITAQAAQSFVGYRNQYGTLRGCMFEASRTGSRSNGRVFLRCKPNTETALAIPEGANLQAMLCNLWNIPEPAAEPARRQHNAETIAADAAKIAEAQRPHKQTGRQRTSAPPPADQTPPQAGSLVQQLIAQQAQPTNGHGRATPVQPI